MSKKSGKTNKRALRTFRVYVGQVNQTFVDVRAANESEAEEAGYRKWRRTEGHSHVTFVEALQ